MYLEMLAGIAEKSDDQRESYEQFGKGLKLGVRDDATNRTKIAELFGWHATRSSDKHLSLLEHVGRMKDGQTYIYYFTDKSITTVSSSPFLGTLNKKGLEAMYTVDPVDKRHVRQLR